MPQLKLTLAPLAAVLLLLLLSLPRPAPSSAGGGGGGGTPGSPMRGPAYGGDSPGPSARYGGGAAAGGAPISEEALAGMTVPQIKDWLMGAGHEADAWALNSRRPAPKKGDWLALARSKAGL